MIAAAVTGIGCVTAAGIGAERAWSAIAKGDVLRRHHAADGPMPAHLTARAPDTSALEPLLPRLSYPRPSRTSMLAMSAAQECWKDAGADGQLSPERTGCAMSRNFGQHDVVAQYNRVLWEKGPASVSGLLFVETIGNTVLGKVCLDLRLRGPSTLNFGAPVLGLALDTLRDGDADAILVGGVDELSLYALTRVCLGGVAAQDETAAGPYDSQRCGLVPGEGAAFLLIETPEHASARGARILGYLRGHASVLDRARSSFDRDPDDIAESIRRALDDAALTAGDVTVVCGSGSGLRGVDGAELLALERVFASPPPLFSCKGTLGESWGASASVSAIAVLHVLSDGTAPPTGGTAAPDRECRVPVIVDRPMAVGRGAALVLSCDMSGQDTAYVFTSEG